MRKSSVNALIFVVSLVLAVLIGEVILRVAGITFPVFETYDPLRGKILKPGKRGWYRAEGEGFISVNQYGFRDDEHPVEKPQQTYRIAVLGDSYVEAREVQLEQTFWKLLEHELAGCPGLAGYDIEVLSFGISGYGQAQELLTLRNDVWRFSPDLVLTLFFAGNDVSDNSPTVHVGGRGMRNQLQPYFTLQNGRLVLDTSFRAVGPTQLWRRFLLVAIHHSRILELVNQVRRSLYTRQFVSTYAGSFIEPGLATFAYAPPQTEEERSAWAITDALLAQMNREVREHGADFLLVTATASIQVEPDPKVRARILEELGFTSLDYAERRLAELGRTEGFDVLTLAKDFRDYAEANKVYLHGFKNTRLGSGHWNDKGHPQPVNE
jgi:hypothetical protein